jgi:stage III sporulation protein AA
MEDGMFSNLPSSITELLARLPPHVVQTLEEIRIRRERPIELLYRGQSVWLAAAGGVTADVRAARIASATFCRQLLDHLTQHSVYSYEEQLRRGYFTIAGGHRVGCSGQTTLAGGVVKLIREVSGFNIRLAREKKEFAAKLLPWLYDGKKGMYLHTLIASPPQHGKTTLLRDLVRKVSDGYVDNTNTRISGRKVGLVDERSEVAGCAAGVPQFDVGLRTDVLDQCPKAEGMMMLIRAMSPHVVAVDEIGRAEDAAAIHEALLAGITVFATIHAGHIQEVMNRSLLRPLFEQQLFQRYVMLQRKEGTHTHIKIYDAHGVCLNTLLEPND